MKKDHENTPAGRARHRALIRSLIERTRAAEEEKREVTLPFADNVEVVFTDPVPVMEIRLAEEEKPLAEIIPFPSCSSN